MDKRKFEALEIFIILQTVIIRIVVGDLRIPVGFAKSAENKINKVRTDRKYLI